MDHCRNMEPVIIFLCFNEEKIDKLIKNNFKIDSEKPVLVAGDPERLNMKKSEENHGISYHINQVKYAVSIFFM